MFRLFPKEIIEHSLEVHQFKHSKKSIIIYLLILTCIIGVLASLPFINITIYNTSQGLLRDEKERVLLQSSSNGTIVYHKIKNNSKVVKGDTLLLINNTSINQKINATSNLLTETALFIDDLKMLCNQQQFTKKLSSTKYIQENLFYQQKLNELQTKYAKVKDDYIRTKSLFEKGVVAKVELNEQQLAYDLALNAIHQYKKQQIATWQAQLIAEQNKLEELKVNQTQLEESNQLTLLKAPVSGTLINVIGIENGGFIQNGTQIGEISPNSKLIVECYVQPSDIGLIKLHTKVNFQVSAFNYNQWGVATGNIIAIGNDVQMVNNTPMFIVRCKLHQNYLQLKNGYKGYLKKGMLVNARFEIAERTLFDLLYDNVDDWLNPTTKIAKK